MIVPVVEALRRLLTHRRNNRGMTVSEDESTVPHRVVDVLIAVHIPLPSPRRMRDVRTKRVGHTHSVRGARGGELPFSLLVQCPRVDVASGISVPELIRGCHEASFDETAC